MVRVCGTPYVRNNNSCRSACSTPSVPSSCSPGRVMHVGPSYIRSPYAPFQSVYVASAPSTLVIESPLRETTVIHHRSRNDDRVVVAAIMALAVLAIIAVAVSYSRDCHFVGTDCSPPNIFGQQVCQDIWDCKW